MSKDIFETVSSTLCVALSELTDEELIDLIPLAEEISGEEQGKDLFDEELDPMYDEVSMEESELFVKLAALLGEVIPYGQAILLLARYTCLVESKMIMCS